MQSSHIRYVDDPLRVMYVANTSSGSCPPDPALGKSTTIDFTQGSSSAFTTTGNPTYGSDGAVFTVAKSGDSPLLTSKWYIMFGHVDYTIKAAPGTGIVSSAVLQSDDLDEIDWEWLGGDDTQVQSNYFGKGQTTTYDRGAFHSDPGNHDSFHTYSVDWTSEQIVWQIDGQTVRVLTQANADVGQYPQTPMQIKVGAWSGGDPSNAPGTIGKLIQSEFCELTLTYTFHSLGWRAYTVLCWTVFNVRQINRRDRLLNWVTIHIFWNGWKLAIDKVLWWHDQWQLRRCCSVSGRICGSSHHLNDLE
jgi:hypothetical protein